MSMWIGMINRRRNNNNRYDWGLCIQHNATRRFFRKKFLQNVVMQRKTSCYHKINRWNSFHRPHLQPMHHSFWFCTPKSQVTIITFSWQKHWTITWSYAKLKTDGEWMRGERRWSGLAYFLGFFCQNKIQWLIYVTYVLLISHETLTITQLCYSFFFLSVSIIMKPFPYQHAQRSLQGQFGRYGEI